MSNRDQWNDWHDAEREPTVTRRSPRRTPLNPAGMLATEFGKPQPVPEWLRRLREAGLL